MRYIGECLLAWHNRHFQYPSICYNDRTGKPQLSYLPIIVSEYEQEAQMKSGLYSGVGKGWRQAIDNPSDVKFMKQTSIVELECPDAMHSIPCNTDYVAIIGPGTIWHRTGTVKLSDLPEGGSRTVVLVEAVNSGVNWAAPFELTVDELLENMRTGKGVRISSCHPAGVNVLFADGSVRTLPAKMPLSLWRKILNGEVPAKDLDRIESQIDPNAPDMVDVYVGTPAPKPWPIILGVFIWLFSIVLLFRRAVKSRKKPEIEAARQASKSA